MCDAGCLNNKKLLRKPFRLQNEYELIQSLRLGRDAMSLLRLAKDYQNNRNVVIAAIEKVAHSIKHASDEFKNDKNIVMLAVRKRASTLIHASKELKDDIDVVILAVSQLGWVIKYASLRLRKDINVIKTALNAKSLGASAYKHIPSKIKKNKEFIIIAIKNDIYWAEPMKGWIYNSLSDELKKDVNIINAENERYERIKDKPVIFR